MYTIGLTGGLATGKTTAADYFNKLGIPVIDADQLAREISNTSPILKQVHREFGKQALTESKHLNRSFLRKVIFSDALARNWLENLLHPLIYQSINEKLKKVKGPFCVIVIPLLFEGRTSSLSRKKTTNFSIILNRILLIAASKTLQLDRAKERDNLEIKQIEAILASQNPLSDSINKADDIIYNQTSLIDLQHSISHFCYFYRCLSYYTQLDSLTQLSVHYLCY